MSESGLVQAHYARGDLLRRLLEALSAVGKDVDRLSRDDLAPIDEFHTRGREATRELARLLNLQPGERVLDVGSGLGGPARTLAHEYGCLVAGVDLVGEFVRVAADLTARVGLSGSARFQQADAMSLPFPDSRFDAVMLQHVTMNIAAKDRLFREAARVLVPGGRLGIYEICAGPGGPAHFPVPWASDARISFLEPMQVYRSHAERAGFTARQWRDDSEAALGWFRAAVARVDEGRIPPLGIHLIMGADAPAKLRNLVRNLEEDRVRVLQAAFGPTRW